MKTILKVQKDGVNTLKQEILSHSNNSLKKIYIFASDIKETGYDVIEECLIDLKAKKFIVIGIDKKNTTRKMLESLLKYTKNVYIWNNNLEVEFKANIYIFEYDDEAHIYLAQGNLTDNMLDTDMSMYTKITYDLIKDKKDYEEYVDILVKEVKSSFEKLTNEYIDELVEQKTIFTTKQYMHVVPSIAELLGKTEQQAVEEVEEIKPLPKIELNKEELNSFEIDLGDISFDEPEVIISESEEVQESEEDAFGLNETSSFEQEFDEEIEENIEEESLEEDEYVVSDEIIDMESLALESSVIKLNKSDIKSKSKKKENSVEDKQTSKKINLSKVSNIIMELGAKPTKGKDVTKIKIPNYIKDMIPNFFEIMDEAKLVKKDDGEYKEILVNLEIIDVNTSNRFIDNNAKLRQKVGQTYIEFDSDKLGDVLYEEMDIARIIKLANDSYHIEIIPQGIDEYSLWDKMCTNSFRGSNRQYGLM